MNGYIIAGILLAALGTYLIQYGARLESARSSTRSQETLDSISRDLAELRGRPKSALTEDAIARVEEDVSSWAREFASDRQKREIRFKAEKSGRDASQQHATELARQYTAFFLQVLRDAVETYKAHAGLKASYVLPDISPSLYDDATAAYTGTIEFGDERRWTITAFNPSPSTGAGGPWVNVDLVPTPNPSPSKATFFFRFVDSSRSYSLVLRGEFADTYSSRNGNIRPTTEFESESKVLIRSLIENEVLQTP